MATSPQPIGVPRSRRHSRPRDQRNQRIQDLLKLQKAAQKINSILDLDLLLERIVNDVATMFGSLETSVWLRDGQTNEMVLAGVRGCTLHKKGARKKIGKQGMVGHVAATGETRYAPDVRLDPYYIACEPDTMSEVDIPLMARGEVIGVFNIVHHELGAFPPEQLNLLEALASQIAVAVENARLFQQERLQRERMSREAEEARLIQQALLPSAYPYIPGFSVEAAYVPAGAVGGDWYDFIPLDNNRWGVMLADVSGKGMAAALLMSATRGVLRAQSQTSANPSEVLQRVNQVLTQDFPAGKFVTMIYGVLDGANRTFTFANAGHPWPLLVEETGARFLPTDDGIPLGIGPGSYSEIKVRTLPGSRLLLYSDGITESVNAEQEEFGTIRLIEYAARPECSAETLIADVSAYSNGWRGDDATVIVVNAHS